MLCSRISGGYRKPKKDSSTLCGKTPDIFVEDHTTQILPEEMMPELPPISDELVPSPAESGANFYFNGKITKAGAGFLLTVDLRKPSDNSLLNEVKTPFANADGAEAAGTTAAAQMLSFLATQTQTARANRATSNYLIKPIITLQFDKLRLKPDEVAHGKVILTDCDGMPLKNREFTAYARLDQGPTLLIEKSGTKTTNNVGEHTGVVSSSEPGILTLVVTLKYQDLRGVPHEISESGSIVISGGEGDLWQMSVSWQYRERDRSLGKDLLTHRTSIGSGLIERKGNLLFLFKATTLPEGDVFTDKITNFNGFGDATTRGSSVGFNNETVKSYAYGTLDQSPEAIQNLDASFSIDPGSKELRFHLNNILFRGQQDSLGCSTIGGIYGCVSKHNEYVVGIDGADKLGGGIPITPEMIRSGIYTYGFQETKQLPVNHTKSVTMDQTNEGSYVFNRVEIKVSRVNPNKGKIIN